MYHRRLKLLDYFSYNGQQNCLPFTSSSNWEPNINAISSEIKHLINEDIKAFRNFKIKADQKQNITREERAALNNLASNANIIIKSADKGGRIVIQDKDNYLKEAHRQLNDTAYYLPLSQPLYLETQKLIRDKIDQLHRQGFINKKQKTYLMGPDPPRPRLFYLLPKIHKVPETWPVRFLILGGRPIERLRVRIISGH